MNKIIIYCREPSNCINCDDYECPICFLICDRPFSTICSCITKLYCDKCLSKDITKCWLCRDPLNKSKIVYSKFAHDKILQLQVKCNFHDFGCEKTFTFSKFYDEFMDHIESGCIRKKLLEIEIDNILNLIPEDFDKTNKINFDATLKNIKIILAKTNKINIKFDLKFVLRTKYEEFYNKMITKYIPTQKFYYQLQCLLIFKKIFTNISIVDVCNGDKLFDLNMNQWILFLNENDTSDFHIISNFKKLFIENKDHHIYTNDMEEFLKLFVLSFEYNSKLYDKFIHMFEHSITKKAMSTKGSLFFKREEEIILSLEKLYNFPKIKLKRIKFMFAAIKNNNENKKSSTIIEEFKFKFINMEIYPCALGLLNNNGCPLPKLYDHDLEKISNFQKYIENKYYEKNKKLVISAIGSAKMEIIMNTTNPPIKFICTTIQMLILLLFDQDTTNKPKILNYRSIVEKIKLNPLVIYNHLLTLCSPKVSVLLKKPNTKNLEKDHLFKLNDKYKYTDRIVTIPLNTYDHNEYNEYYSNTNLVDGHIYRIVKNKKRIHYSSLLVAVLDIKEILKRPKIVDIREGIERQIQKGYIKRDKSDKNYLVYNV